MTFDQVDFFMSCAACLNFSLASKYHFVSVSTLSRSISSLEQELGLVLFERGYHGHRLTEAGKSFFECCINSTTEFNKFLIDWSKITKDTIRIGCYPNNSSFEKFINSYSKAAPDYFTKKLKVLFIKNDCMAEAIESGYVSVGIMSRSEFYEYEDLKSIPFFTDENNEFVFVAAMDFDDKEFTKFSRLVTYIK